MKVVSFLMILSTVVLCSACATAPPAEEQIDYTAWPVEALESNLKTLEQQTALAFDRKTVTREAFEQLRDEYDAAGTPAKPDTGVLFATAAADYLTAQKEHLELKQELRQVRRAYIHKLIVTGRTAERTAQVEREARAGERLGTWGTDDPYPAVQEETAPELISPGLETEIEIIEDAPPEI